jgi:phenylacetate-CoA ligase
MGTGMTTGLRPDIAERFRWTGNRSVLEQAQWSQLQVAWSTVLASNRFWQQRAAQAGVPPRLASWSDWRRLPTLRKADLVADQAACPPYGTNLSQPLQAYTRLHQTSGTTTGVPLRWLDTPRNWQAMLDSWQLLYSLMPLEPHDRCCFPFSFGPFLGFWAGFEAAVASGHFSLAAGGLSTEARLRLISDHQITLVGCTPTYALRLAEVAQQHQLDLASFAVRKILVAGEPGGHIQAVRDRLETLWSARVIDHWGMTEVGPLAIESAAHPGCLTMLETDCLVEILQLDRDDPVAPGELGELTISTFTRLDSPVFRYRTGDLVRQDLSIAIDTAPPRPDTPAQPTENVLLRLAGGILGRTDDMLIVRGNNVFPSSIEAVVREFAEIVEFRILVQKQREMLDLTVEFEPLAELTPDRISVIATQLVQRLKDRLSFQVRVQAVSPGSLPRFEMKARRVVVST